MGTPVPQSSTVTVPIQSGSPGNVVISLPSGTADGDLLLAFVGITNESSSSETINPPAGWSLIGSVIGNNTYLSVYSKIASSEPSTWNFGVSNTIGHSQFRQGACARFTDYYVSSPVDGVSVATATTGSSVGTRTATFSNTISPTITSDLILLFSFNRADGSPTVFDAANYAIATNNPGVWTELFDSFGTVSAGSTGISMAMGYATRPATGATGNSSLTLNPNSSTATVSAAALICLTRNIISSIAVKDTVVSADTMSLSAIYLAKVTDAIATLDLMYLTASKVITNLAKSTANWINRKKNT